MSFDKNKFIAFSKPFVENLKEVITQMAGAELKPGAPSIKSDNILKGDVSAMIGVSGIMDKDGDEAPYVGLFIISFPMQTYLNIASSVLGEEYTEFDPDIADVGAEISNIVTGNAKVKLGEDGYKLEMATPTTISGKDHSINYPRSSTVVMIPFESDKGNFFAEVCFKSS